MSTACLNNWPKNPDGEEWQLTWGLDPKASCSGMLFPETIADLLEYLIIHFTWIAEVLWSSFLSPTMIWCQIGESLGCSLGHCKMRCTLAPLHHLSWPLKSWLMIICCWQTSWCVIEVTYCGLILTREYIMNLICNLLCFYIKWRTTKHNEYASECRLSVKVNQS